MATNETNIQKWLDELLNEEDEERLNNILKELGLLQTGTKDEKVTRINNALEGTMTKNDYPPTSKHTETDKDRREVALHDIINEDAIQANTNKKTRKKTTKKK